LTGALFLVIFNHFNGHSKEPEMKVQTAIEQRRSIRRYTSEMPSREDVHSVLEAARMAPSWANTQCWEFIIIAESSVKARLAETLPEKNPARPALLQAPLIIAACARTGVSGFFKGAPATDKGDWLLFDTALALQNLTLRAHELGLGTVHVGFFDAVKAAEILGVPTGITVVDLMPLGYPAEPGRPTPRKPLEEFVFYERHGGTVCSL
jgi:nitroreductase